MYEKDVFGVLMLVSVAGLWISPKLSNFAPVDVSANPTLLASRSL